MYTEVTSFICVESMYTLFSVLFDLYFTWQAISYLQISQVNLINFFLCGLSVWQIVLLILSICLKKEAKISACAC